MPINYADYPDDWQEIRQRILKRDNHRCKFCGVRNYAIIWRCPSDPSIYSDCYEDGARWYQRPAAHEIKIVLTTAHLHDPDPHNISDDNLAMLCQRCHLALDAPLKAQRRLEKQLEAQEAAGQLTLPFDESARS